MSTTIRLLLALLMISLAGCGGDDGTAPGTQPDDPVASGTIDADGGEIGDADVTLTVPPGALDDETDLEIYLEDEGQPYGESGEPVYRVGGLPQQLDAPLTVRLRHGGGKDRETVPYLFIGEERESIHGGTGVTWEAVAAVDSSGWMVAHLPRGPYETGDKYDRALWLSPSTIISSVHLVGGHFKVFYLEEEVETARATVVAKTFEQMYDTLYGIGFHFGEQDTIWPLPVMMRKPVAASHAEYWSGPWGKGHFNLETYMALEGNPLREVVLHEIFHCAQDYYDTRHPTTWATINPHRRWLDEATAAWLEGLASGNPGEYSPVGVNLDNYLAPLSGIWGHDEHADNLYGYGMSSFIRRLMILQGTERLHELYVAFSYHGTAYDALIAIMDPPLDDWCAQFQRDLITGDSTPEPGLELMWWNYPEFDDLSGTVGDSETVTFGLHDFGSDIKRIGLDDYEPDQDTSLKVKVQTPAAYELAAYGYNDDALPVLITTGTDSLTVDDWPTVLATYQDLIVQAIKPRGAEPDYYHPVEVDVRLEVVQEQDLERYEYAQISMRYNARWNGGDPAWQNLNFHADDGQWNGGTYTAAWDSTDNGTRFFGTFNCTVDPTDLTLTSWSAQSTWEYDALNQNYYETAGSGAVPLTYTSSDYLRWNLDDQAVCDATSTIVQYTIRNGSTDDEMTQWTCDDDSYFVFWIRDER